MLARSLRNGDEVTRSVEIEAASVIPLELRIPLFFPQEAVADYQHLDLGTHKAAEGVFGRTDNRLATDVKACIDT